MVTAQTLEAYAKKPYYPVCDKRANKPENQS
jgi:hypothetical protein